MKLVSCFILMLLGINTVVAQTYTMPHENEPHEGTWLQWPHQFEYGMAYRNSLDATWVAMTAALVSGEKVHIVAYDNTEKSRIIGLLTTAGVPLTNVDFYIFPTNDVWVRDNGPIFVYDALGNLNCEDWGFNGWGGKFNYNLCNPIPTSIAVALSIPTIDLNTTMVNEGGAVEMDGSGVLMACKSSIISQTPANSVRNPGMTQAQAELYFAQYLGVTKFIWLNGNVGDPNDITDFHIDGFAKFVNDSILVTMSNTDLTYWGLSAADLTILNTASNASGITYQKVNVPLTQNNVVNTFGVNLGYKGSYVNYYVANTVVLVPNYSDPNDAVANAIIQGLFPTRTVVGIDVKNLYEYGGMVHCVTQQQPVATVTGAIDNTDNKNKTFTVFPNPFSNQLSIKTAFALHNASITIQNNIGKIVKHIDNVSGNQITLQGITLPDGIYFICITEKTNILATQKVILAH